MTDLLFLLLWLLGKGVWLVWAGALLGDVILSRRFAPGCRLHQLRWVPRLVHALCLTGGTLCNSPSSLLLAAVAGGPLFAGPAVVIAGLVFYVSLKLGQRLELPPVPAASARLYSGTALALPAAMGLLLLLAMVNCLTELLPSALGLDDLLIIVSCLATLVTVGYLARSPVRRVHVLLPASLAGGSLLLLILLITLQLLVPGALPGERSGSAAAPYALTGLLSFTVVCIAAGSARNTASTSGAAPACTPAVAAAAQPMSRRQKIRRRLGIGIALVCVGLVGWWLIGRLFPDWETDLPRIAEVARNSVRGQKGEACVAVKLPPELARHTLTGEAYVYTGPDGRLISILVVCWRGRGADFSGYVFLRKDHQPKTHSFLGTDVAIHVPAPGSDRPGTWYVPVGDEIVEDWFSVCRLLD